MSESRAVVAWTPPGGGARRCTFAARCTVGRAPSNRIILDDPGISREQAVFELSVSRLRLVNRSRTCSMTLNGLHGIAPGAETGLRQGDRVQIGSAVLSIAELVLAHRAVRCPNAECAREVAPHLRDCPWCGRSLAFAFTDLASR